MFSKSKDEQTPPKTPKLPAASAPQLSIIAADVRITGNIVTAGELQLDGEVDGDVRCSALTLGETGRLDGTIDSGNVTIRGRVQGSIRARNVVLERTARIMGDITHSSVSIEAGARIDGTFVHASEEEDVTPATSHDYGELDDDRPMIAAAE